MKSMLIFILGSLITMGVVQAQEQKLESKKDEATIVDAQTTSEAAMEPINPTTNVFVRKSLSEQLFVLETEYSQFNVGLQTSQFKSEFEGYYGRKYTDNSLSFEYLSGLSDSTRMLSIRSTLGTAELEREETSSKPKFTGFSDLIIGLRNLVVYSDAANLIFGADLGISPDANKRANSSVDGNRFSGGHSLKPYVGFETAMGANVYGGLLSYDYKLERKSGFSAGNLTETTTGGHQFSMTGFFEKSVTSAALLGGSVSYASTGSRESVENDDGDVSTSTSKSFSDWSIGAYGAFAFTNSTSLKPSVKYTQMIETERNGVKVEVNNELAVSAALSSTF